MYIFIYTFIIMETTYYLYSCNLNHDIENNIGEIEIPEFTMEHVQLLDEKYKMHYSQVTDFECQDQNDILTDNNMNNITCLFELNELFIEHENIIEILTDKVNEYNSIENTKTTKLQMYFQEILPNIHNDENNLNSVLDLLSSL
jgi:hypothetical protein